MPALFLPEALYPLILIRPSFLDIAYLQNSSTHLLSAYRGHTKGRAPREVTNSSYRYPDCSPKRQPSRQRSHCLAYPPITLTIYPQKKGIASTPHWSITKHTYSVQGRSIRFINRSVGPSAKFRKGGLLSLVALVATNRYPMRL